MLVVWIFPALYGLAILSTVSILCGDRVGITNDKFLDSSVSDWIAVYAAALQQDQPNLSTVGNFCVDFAC